MHFFISISVRIVKEQDEFRKLILSSKEPLVALFEASYCPFCVTFRPIVEKYTQTLRGSLVAVSLDDFENPLWDHYSIEVVPSLIVFFKGKPVFRINGILGVGLSENDLKRIKSFLESNELLKMNNSNDPK